MFKQPRRRSSAGENLESVFRRGAGQESGKSAKQGTRRGAELCRRKRACCRAGFLRTAGGNDLQLVGMVDQEDRGSRSSRIPVPSTVHCGSGVEVEVRSLRTAGGSNLQLVGMVDQGDRGSRPCVVPRPSRVVRPSRVLRRREAVPLRRVREAVQEVVDAEHAPADPRRHPAVRVPVLPQALPPEVRHEETHLRTHR